MIESEVRRRFPTSNPSATIGATSVGIFDTPIGTPPSGFYWLVEGLSLYLNPISATPPGIVPTWAFLYIEIPQFPITPLPLIGGQNEGNGGYIESYPANSPVVSTGEQVTLRTIIDNINGSNPLITAINAIVTIGEIQSDVAQPPDASTGVELPL